MANVSSSNSQGELIPKLRFPGFEGEWKQRTFSDLFSFLGNNTLSRADLSNSGEIKNIHYGDVLIKFDDTIGADDPRIPYVTSPESLKKDIDLLRTGDVIIADTAEDDTAGKATELLNPTNIPVVSGLHTIPVRPNDEFYPSYLGYYINSKSYHSQLYPLMQGIKVTSISKGNIGKTLVRYPSRAEQQKIASVLNLLTQRIAKQRESIELLKSYKRGALQQIFEDKASIAEWQVVQLQDVFNKVSRRNKNGIVKNVITNSAEYGLVPQRDFFDKDIAVDGNTDNYYIIETGDFVYNPRKSKTAPYGPFNRYELEDRGIISPLYTCLVLTADINPSYLSWYFKSNAWHRYIYDNGSQGVRHDRVSMTDDLLMGIPVLIPEEAVQQKIAKTLDLLEKSITKAEELFKALQDIKAALLREMFI